MTSVLKLGERWGWSRNKVLRYLELLESEQMLNTKRTPKGTLVSIVKYEEYQVLNFTDDTTNDTTIGTTHETTDETPLDTTGDTTDELQKKNIKNIKNDKELKNVRIKEKEVSKDTSKKKVIYPNDEKLNQAFLDFMEMRNKIKRPMTDRAVNLAMNKLSELSTLPFSDLMDNDLAIKILEQSTMNCWQSLYPLKDNKASNVTKSTGGIDWDNI